MSNLTANLSISSNNLLSTPINLSSSKSSVVQNYGKMGSIKIQPSEKAYLTEFKCGPKGAYVYVKSPTSNPSNVSIKIHKESNEIPNFDLNLFTPNAINHEESFITLLPGDFAWVPVSFSCRALYATTSNNAEATLEFMYADRGGEFGNSVINLSHMGNENEDWYYFVTDAQTGEPGQVYPLGIGNSSWNLNHINFIQNSGYILEFQSGPITKIFFIGADGNIIKNEIPEIFNIRDLDSNSNESVTSSGSRTWLAESNSYGDNNDGRYSTNPIGYAKAYILVYTENYNNSIAPGTPAPKTKIAYFDGNEIHYHDIMNLADNPILFYLDASYDYSTQDGTVCLYFDSNNGDVRYPNTAFYMLVNKTQHIILDIYESGYAWYSWSSINSNVITFFKISNFDNQVTEMRIYNTKGKLLKDINLSSISAYGLDVHFYGKGSIQVILSNEFYYYMINYNESLDRLIGDGLDWTDDVNKDYTIAYNGNYPLVDFEAPYSNYEGGSVAIMFYNTTNTDSYKPANREVDYCRIHYIIPGFDKQMYNFVDDWGSGIWVNNRGAGTWDGILALKEAIVIPFTSGYQMWNLVLKGNSIGANRIPQFDYYEGYIDADYISDWSFRAISDTQFYYWIWTNDSYSNYMVLDTGQMKYSSKAKSLSNTNKTFLGSKWSSKSIISGSTGQTGLTGATGAAPIKSMKVKNSSKAKKSGPTGPIKTTTINPIISATGPTSATA